MVSVIIVVLVTAFNDYTKEKQFRGISFYSLPLFDPSFSSFPFFLPLRSSYPFCSHCSLLSILFLPLFPNEDSFHPSLPPASRSPLPFSSLLFSVNSEHGSVPGTTSLPSLSRFLLPRLLLEQNQSNLSSLRFQDFRTRLSMSINSL